MSDKEKSEVKEETKDTQEEENKFIVDALNIHGSFFHKKCIEVISSHGSYKVAEKEFPIELSGEFTKIDIIAERNLSDHTNHHIIECKKVDNNFKTWVFFPDVIHGNQDASVIKKDDKIPLIVDAVIPKRNEEMRLEPGLDVLRFFFYPKDSRSQEIHFDICYDAYQIKYDNDKNGKLNWQNIHKSAKKDDIEKACNQVLLGARGYANQKCKRFTNKEAINGGYVIPIIVTTAKLMMGEVDTKHIDLKEGTVKNTNDVKLKPVDWLVYNYKPNFMLKEENQIPFFEKPKSIHSVHVEEKLNDSIDYVMSVFVVNSEALEDFLTKFEWA